MKTSYLKIGAAVLILFGGERYLTATDNESGGIEKAIAGLGDKSFKVREQSVQKLLEIGEPAEAALETASRSSDPEIAARATGVLKTVRTGLLPDVPAHIASLINGYGEAQPDRKAAIIEQLAEDRAHGERAAVRLLLNESDDDVQKGMWFALGDRTLSMARGLIVAGKTNQLGALVEIGVALGDESWIRGLASLCALNGTVGDEIARRSKAADTREKARTLAYLHRANGEPAKSLEAAASEPDTDLRMSLLMEAGDWKQLAKLHSELPDSGGVEWLGFHAAFSRLAGDTNELKGAIDKLVDFSRNHPDSRWHAAEALLVNDEIEKATEVLGEDKALAHAASVLVEQYRCREVLDIADDFRKREEPVPPLLANLVARITGLADTSDEITPMASHDLEEEYFSQSGVLEFVKKADKLAADGKWAEAAAEYGKVASNGMHMALPMYLQGHALLKAGKAEQGRGIMATAEMLPLFDDTERYFLTAGLSKRGMSEAALRQNGVMLRTAGLRSWWLREARRRVTAHDPKRKKDFATRISHAEQERLGTLFNNASYLTVRSYLAESAAIASYRAVVALSAGDVDGARRLMRRACATMPKDDYQEVCREFVRAGHKELADETFTCIHEISVKACKEYPNFAELLNNTAWTCARFRTKLDEALKLAERAVELRPRSAAYIDTLAEVHFQLGNTDKAIELMKRCIELEPDFRYFAGQLKRFKAGDKLSDPETDGE